MPRDLFGDVTRPSISIGNRKWYTVPVSLLSHSAVVVAVIVIPLLATDTLPAPWQKIGAVTLLEPPVPPSPPPPKRNTDVPRQRPLAPIAAPTGFTPEPDVPDSQWREPDLPGVITGDTDTAASLIAPPPPPTLPPEPVRVGGAIRQPQKIREVAPIYPPIAQAARVQGMVIIEATIGADGRVVNARILRSVPLLDEAALDAVRRWEYTPTLLNGVPVPVIMTVTVQFTLSR